MKLEWLATDLGDLMCVSAMAVIVCFWCWRQLDRLGAVAFGLAYVSAVILTTGMKMISAQVSPSPYDAPPFQLSSGAPSGHVTLAVLVYGAAAYLCGRAKGWDGGLGRIAYVLVILVIAVTRVTLHTHTIADVIAGMAVGGLILAAPIALVWSRPHAPRGVGSVRWLMLGMAGAGVFVLASGVRLSSHDFNLAQGPFRLAPLGHGLFPSNAVHSSLTKEL